MVVSENATTANFVCLPVPLVSYHLSGVNVWHFMAG